MITVERDYNSFVLKVKDEGFGSYEVKARDLDAALVGIRHYYGRGHDKASCPMCKSEIAHTKVEMQLAR